MGGCAELRRRLPPWSISVARLPACQLGKNNRRYRRLIIVAVQTELERSKLITLVAQTPPGRPVRQADGQLIADHPTQPTQWSLDALVSAAHQQGITIQRSQLRRILLKERVRWRQVRSWIVSKDPNFVPKGRRSSKPTPSLKPTRRPCA
jgi:hypothetical protein